MPIILLKECIEIILQYDALKNQDFYESGFYATIIYQGLFIKRHINHRGLFNAKNVFAEEQHRYYMTHSRRDKRVHIFPKSERISAVHHFDHYIARKRTIIRILSN